MRGEFNVGKKGVEAWGRPMCNTQAFLHTCRWCSISPPPPPSPPPPFPSSFLSFYLFSLSLFFFSFSWITQCVVMCVCVCVCVGTIVSSVAGVHFIQMRPHPFPPHTPSKDSEPFESTGEMKTKKPKRRGRNFQIIPEIFRDMATSETITTMMMETINPDRDVKRRLGTWSCQLKDYFSQLVNGLMRLEPDWTGVNIQLEPVSMRALLMKRQDQFQDPMTAFQPVSNIFPYCSTSECPENLEGKSSEAMQMRWLSSSFAYAELTNCAGGLLAIISTLFYQLFAALPPRLLLFCLYGF